MLGGVCKSLCDLPLDEVRDHATNVHADDLGQFAAIFMELSLRVGYDGIGNDVLLR